MSRHVQSTALVLLLALLAASCAHKKKAVIAPPPLASPAVVGATETGVASWYGYPYNGRRASDGEIYDMETLVAAHRTLPFHTLVRVYDLDNGKTVDVRIIDRGPFVDGRIIDLSHAAAKAIGMLGPGTANVRIQVLEALQPITTGLFAVQVGAFRDRQNAERAQREMQSYGESRIVLERGFWRVLVGREPTEDAARALAARIRKNSPEKNAAFVVRIDSEAS